MCRTCVEFARRKFPHFSEKEIGTLLWGATSFPFGDADRVCREVKELAEQSNGNLDECLAIADREMEAALASCRSDHA
jgi:hypothetical protein